MESLTSLFCRRNKLDLDAWLNLAFISQNLHGVDSMMCNELEELGKESEVGGAMWSPRDFVSTAVISLTKYHPPERVSPIPSIYNRYSVADCCESN